MEAVVLFSGTTNCCVLALRVIGLFFLHFCHGFLGGVLSFIASLAGGTVLDVWEFNPYPHHLMTNAPGGVRGTPLNDEE